MKSFFKQQRKFLLAHAILFVCGISFFSSTVYAQPAPPQPCSSTAAGCPPTCNPGYVAVNYGAGPTCVDQAAANALNQSGNNISTQTGSWVLSYVLEGIGWISIAILKVASWLTYLSGAILNVVVQYTVVEMAVRLGPGPDGIGDAINTAWTALRDISNMVFIFVLMYAAIQTILGVGQSTQKLIRNVVLIAILINFSLFATKLIIDASNVLAITFYDAIAPGALQVQADFGISNSLMQPLGIQNLYNVASGFDGEQLLIVGVMGIIICLIAAFVFFAIALMFVIRFVVLIFVLILSPIAFMGSILPEIKSRVTNKWIDALMGQAFFAPIYFVLTWIVIVIARSLPTNQATWKEVATGTLDAAGQVLPPTTSAVQLALNFIILIVFLIASLILSKDWAGKAGGAVSGATKWLTGAAFGTAAFAGRQTLGRGAEMLKNTDAYKKMEKASANRGLSLAGAGGFASRMALSGVDKTRKSSFDARSGKIGDLGRSVGVESGTFIQQQGGFEADRKMYKEFMEKPGTESFKKREERARQAATHLGITDNAGIMAEYEKLRIADDNARNGGPALSAADATRFTALKTQADAFEQTITKASAKEIEAIVDSNRELLKNQEFANRISVQQLEAINKSDKFSEQDKDTLRNNRFSSLGDLNDAAGLAALAIPAATRTPVQIVDAARVTRARRKTKALTDSEIEMLDSSLMRDEEFIGQLRQGQVDGMVKSPKFTQNQKDKLREIRRKPLIDALNTGRTADVEKLIKKTDPKVLATYMNIPGRGGVNIARDPAVINAYTPQMLKRMAPEMTQDDIDTLRADILTTLAAAPGATPHPTVTWLNDARGGMVDFR